MTNAGATAGAVPSTPSTQHFYIGDEKVAPPVVVHCFRARDVAGAEVPLMPDLVFTQLCLGLVAAAEASTSVFVDASSPHVAAFSELPAGFVDSQLASRAELVHLLHQQRLSAARADDTLGSLAAAKEEAWAARVEATLAPCVDFCLWAHGPCYRRHTRPAVRRGAAVMAWPLAWHFCASQRATARLQLQLRFGGDRLTTSRLLVEEVQELLNAIEAQKPCRKLPWIPLWELMLLAHACPLLAVPKDLLPEPLDAWQKQIDRIKALAANVETRIADTVAGRVLEGSRSVSDETVEMHREPPVTWARLELHGSEDWRHPSVARASVKGEFGPKVGTTAFKSDAGRASASGGDEDEDSLLMKAGKGHWRANAAVTAWITVSLGLFSYWNWSRQRH